MEKNMEKKINYRKRVWNSMKGRRKKKKHLNSSVSDDESRQCGCEFIEVKESQQL